MSAAFAAGLMFLVLAGGVSQAFAQASSKPKEEPLRPPIPTQTDSAPVLLTYVMGLAIGGAILYASLMSSKRGHQD
ncbi:MAG: hypothetical protein SFZ23_00310 [Planctomycetota bacterium]|nr:hypothetical protein [Planctomycetota bacterium]